MSDIIETFSGLTLKHNPEADKIIFDLNTFDYVIEDNMLIITRKNNKK